MRSVHPLSVAVACFVSVVAGPVRARAQGAIAEATDGAPIGSGRARSSADDDELGRTARLATILRLALDRNRELAEGQAWTAAAEARGRAAARLPDLEVKYEQWGVPLSRPAALDQAQTLMFGVRQMFPAWGALGAHAQAAMEEAGGANDAWRVRRREIAAQVRRTFAMYFQADRELRLHLEHVELTSRALELVRLNQGTGHGSLRDVLRVQIELARLHADAARMEREQRSSRSLLNMLMDRPPDAPLGPPEELTVGATPDVAAVEKNLDSNRAEVDAASRAVRRSQAALDEARRSARFPRVMVGVDYWLMPASASFHHAYAAMVDINLPWLSGSHRDEERAAEQAVLAETHALESTKNTIRYELHDAAARVESARRSFAIVDGELMAQAQHSLEEAQAEYAAGHSDAAGWLDALRDCLQVRIERVRALAELATSETEWDRAAGTLVPDDASRANEKRTNP